MALIAVIYNVRPLHDVMSESKTRQNMTKKRSLWSISPGRPRRAHNFESFFNAVFVSAVVVQKSQRNYLNVTQLLRNKNGLVSNLSAGINSRIN